MTPEELVADTRKTIGAPKRPATQTEIALATIALTVTRGTSSGFLYAKPPVVPELKLDTRVIE